MEEAQLRKHLSELERHLEALRTIYGTKLYAASDPRGASIVGPVLIALVEGYSALVNARFK